MIHFIAGALVGLVLANLGASLGRGARGALGRWINAPAAFADIARREALARRAGLVLALALFLGATLLLYLALWRDPLPPAGSAAADMLDRAALGLQAEFAALERRLLTARGFRALLGFAFGLGLAELLHRWSAARAGGPGPWWTSPAAALPAALLLVAVFALVAPRGELDMAFLQRVKTPFGEAEFARDERQVRLELVSEPQGLFPFQRKGLGDAIDIARADLQMREAIAPSADATARARAAFDFIVRVLQPIALCIQQIDALYGDQELLTDNLSVMGANMARALILARAQTSESVSATTRANGRHAPVSAPRYALQTGPWTLQINRWREIPALAATVGPDKPYTSNLCDFSTSPIGDPSAALMSISDEDLRQILAHPSVVHAASMFFLWSGNPRAAKTMIVGAEGKLGAETDDTCPALDLDRPLGNHGLWLISGYVDRWIDAGDPDIAVSKIACGYRALDQRIAKLREKAGDVIEKCPEPPKLAPEVTYDPGSVDTLPAERAEACAGLTPEACKAQLAMGFFAFAQRRLRNHLVFEAAIAALNATDVEAARTLLDTHRRTAADLEQDATATERCFPVQRVAAAAAGSEEPKIDVTTANPDEEAALFLDSIGLFRLAEGLRWNDDDRVEAAVELFDRAMETGGAHIGAPLRDTVAMHRRQALIELGAVVD